MTLGGVVLVSLLFCWVWNEIFFRLAHRLGALSQGIPNQRRWDSSRKPIIGGIAFFIVMLGIGAWQPNGYTLPIAFLAGGTLAFLVGLADDAYVTSPSSKFFGQLAAGGLTILLGGPQIDLGNPSLSAAFTLFWFTAVMNAFNMMDNMDGISGSVALPLLLWGYWMVGPGEGVIYLALAGALIAFLVRNWPPAAFYMGDNGSQFLGYVLAYLGLDIAQRSLAPSWLTILALVQVYSLLAGDTFWVIMMRLLKRKSPFIGGTDHLSHRLARWGLAPTSIALSFLALQSLLCWISHVLWQSLDEAKGVWLGLLLIVLIGIGIGAIHVRELVQGLGLQKVPTSR